MLMKLMCRLTKYLLDKSLDSVIERCVKNLDEIPFKEQLNIAEIALFSSGFDFLIDPSNKSEITCKGLEELSIGLLDEKNKKFLVQFLEIPVCKGEKWFKDWKLVYLCKNRNYNNLLIFTNLPGAYENKEAEFYMCDKLKGTNFKAMLLPNLLKMYKDGLLR